MKGKLTFNVFNLCSNAITSKDLKGNRKNKEAKLIITRRYTRLKYYESLSGNKYWLSNLWNISLKPSIDCLIPVKWLSLQVNTLNNPCRKEIKGILITKKCLGIWSHLDEEDKFG